MILSDNLHCFRLRRLHPRHQIRKRLWWDVWQDHVRLKRQDLQSWHGPASPHKIQHDHEGGVPRQRRESTQGRDSGMHRRRRQRRGPLQEGKWFIIEQLQVWCWWLSSVTLYGMGSGSVTFALSELSSKVTLSLYKIYYARIINILISIHIFFKILISKTSFWLF